MRMALVRPGGGFVEASRPVALGDSPFWHSRDANDGYFQGWLSFFFCLYCQCHIQGMLR